MLLQIVLGDDDLATMVVVLLGPIDATLLRAVCMPARHALTSSHWASLLWRRWLAAAVKGPLWRPQQLAAPPTTIGAHDFLRFKEIAGARFMKVHRTRKLTVALRERGLRLRRCSWLCNRYIEGRHAQADTLEAVVDCMEEMNFFFCCTEYARCRDVICAERWEDAVQMAVDSFTDAIFSSALDGPAAFHVPFDTAALSKAAKDRAMRWYMADLSTSEIEKLTSEARPMVQIAEDSYLQFPTLVRSRMAELRRRLSEPGCRVNERLEERRYAELDAPSKRRMRDQARSHATAFQLAEAAALETHLHTLAAAARCPVGTEHYLPPGLDIRLRATLHDHAEVLGLGHESRGAGEERCLVVWRREIHPKESDASDDESDASDEAREESESAEGEESDDGSDDDSDEFIWQ